MNDSESCNDIKLIIAKQIDSQSFKKEPFKTKSNMQSRRNSALEKAKDIIDSLKENNYEIKKKEIINDSEFYEGYFGP